MSDGNAAYWDAVLFDRIAPKPPAPKPAKSKLSRKLSRCERRTAALLIELGPVADMTTPERAVLNTLAVVCRGCGKCPDMQRLSITTRDP